jgi:hypothetical protein
MYQKEKTEREGFIQDVSKRKNRTSESEVRFRLKPSYTPSRQNPYLLNPLPRRLGKINHRFKTRYFFFVVFIIPGLHQRARARRRRRTLLRPAASLRTRSRGIAPRHPSRRAPPQPELTIAISLFIIQYLRAGFRSLHAPEGGVAMPSLSEGNLDLKIGYLMWL